jgi:hypothetical protein
LSLHRKSLRFHDTFCIFEDPSLIGSQSDGIYVWGGEKGKNALVEKRRRNHKKNSLLSTFEAIDVSAEEDERDTTGILERFPSVRMMKFE